VCAKSQDEVSEFFNDVVPEGCLVTMLRVFMDLGHKKDKTDEVMNVASVIFQKDDYKLFRRPWEKMLFEWKASAFHATDFYPGGGEFKRDTPQRKELFERHSKQIPLIIGRNIKRAQLVSFRPAEFMQMVPQKWKEQLGTDLHSHAVQMILILNGYWRMDQKPIPTFAYFKETGDDTEGEVSKAISRMMQDKGPTGSLIGVSSFGLANKGTARGLEAADFLAWHWNKHYMDWVRPGRELEGRKDFNAFIKAANGRAECMFISGDRLKYFFSRQP